MQHSFSLLLMVPPLSCLNLLICPYKRRWCRCRQFWTTFSICLHCWRHQGISVCFQRLIKGFETCARRASDRLRTLKSPWQFETFAEGSNWFLQLARLSFVALEPGWLISVPSDFGLRAAFDCYSLLSAGCPKLQVAYPEFTPCALLSYYDGASHHGKRASLQDLHLRQASHHHSDYWKKLSCATRRFPMNFLQW